MSDISAHTETRMGSARSFGLVFGGVFLVLGLASLMFGGHYWPYQFAIAAAFTAVALLAPGLLRVPNLIWFKFGLLLHAIFSPLVMLAIYVVTIVPTGLIFRLRGKDLLHQRIDPAAPSYWVERIQKPGSMTRQF